MDIFSHALSKKYTKDTALGLGAVKGAPCTVKNIEQNDDGSKITLEWTNTNGVKETTSFFIKHGQQGNSIIGVDINENGELLIQMSDGTHIIAGKIPVTKLSDLENDTGFITKDDISELSTQIYNIEYQTITTEEAYEHKDLPEGGKTVAINGDGVFGENAYVYSGVDMVPRKTFNQKFPYNGITMEKEGYIYHVLGTTSTDSAQVVLGYTTDDFKIPVDGLIGKTLCLKTFSNEILGNKMSAKIQFFNSKGAYLQTLVGGILKNQASCYVANKTLFGSVECIVPENASYMSITLSVNANSEVDNYVQVYITVNEDTQVTTISEPVVVITDTTARSILSFPYQSNVEIKTPIDKYIDYKANNAKGDTATYLTPEAFGAIGDGYTDDGEAISLCLAEAYVTKQMVLMAKKYCITSPINISYSGLQIVINDIVYTGTNTALNICAPENTIKINSITSSGIGITFSGNADKKVTHNDLEIKSITSDSHGIVFYKGHEKSIYQTTVRFNKIKAGGDNCYGICYLSDGDGKGFVGENNFYGGQIRDCEWAVYACNSNSKFYGIHIEDNVQGGFYITGYITIFHPRNAEAQRDGTLPFYKFINTEYVTIYNSSHISINNYDLSEAIDSDSNGHALRESQFGVINGGIIPCSPTGANVNIGTVYANKAYVWGKYLIMQPHMAYRKVVTTSTFDTKTIETQKADDEIKKLSQLPTQFIVDNISSDIYLHSSYCAFGFNEFEVEQSNGFVCKIYDCLNNLIFNGENYGNGTYKLKVYKDAEYCETNSSGMLRRDFLGHYWEVTKEGISVTDDGAGNVTLTTEVVSV